MAQITPLIIVLIDSLKGGVRAVQMHSAQQQQGKPKAFQKPTSLN